MQTDTPANKQIEAHLHPGETLLWAGRQTQPTGYNLSRVMSSPDTRVLGRLTLLFFAITLYLSLATYPFGLTLDASAQFCLWGTSVIMFIFSLAAWDDCRRWKSHVYAVTTQRLILLENGKAFSASLAELEDISVGPCGISFKLARHDMWSWFFSPHRHSLLENPWCFYQIENPEEVANIIRKAAG